MNEYGEDILLELDLIHVGGLGIYEEQDKEAFSIYPNPSHGKLFIEAKGGETIEQILVRNVNGQTVLTHQPSASLIQTLDLSSIEAGLYFVELRTGEKIYLEQVVIK